MQRIVFAVFMGCLGSFLISAQDTAELLNRMKAMEEKIKSLETEVQEPESQQSALTRRNGW